MFTAIIFRKTDFDETAILSAVEQVEKEFPIPHPHPKESLTKVDLNEEVTAVFYEIGGYPSRAKCFAMAAEFLEVDYFLNMIEDATKEKLKEYCFYSVFYCDMDGYETSFKFSSSSFEYRQIMDGSGMRHYTDECGKINTMQQEVSSRTSDNKEGNDELFSADGLLMEFGISIQDLIGAYNKLNNHGIVIWSYEESKG